MYAIIMAGGGGSRLWPRSRNNTPKQLLTLVSPVRCCRKRWTACPR